MGKTRCANCLSTSQSLIIKNLILVLEFVLKGIAYNLHNRGSPCLLKEFQQIYCKAPGPPLYAFIIQTLRQSIFQQALILVKKLLLACFNKLQQRTLALLVQLFSLSSSFHFQFSIHLQSFSFLCPVLLYSYDQHTYSLRQSMLKFNFNRHFQLQVLGRMYIPQCRRLFTVLFTF